MHLTGALLDGSDLLRAYVRGARACNTQRAYAAQWQQFATWCSRQGVSALPADPRLVAEYLAVRAQAGVAVASINVTLAAVCFMHKMSGFGFARTDPILTLVLDGIRRQHIGLQRQAEPLTARLLVEVLAHLGAEPADLRDAALLSLLYAFALRASEIVALDWQQLGSGRGWLAVAADKIEIVLLGSKACQQRAQHVAIPVVANPRMLAALLRWIDHAQIEPGEAIARPLARGGTIRTCRLDAASVSGIVKRVMARHLQQVGHDFGDAVRQARRFGSHSGRVGLYVSASEAGVPAQHIAALARHKSLAMALRYTRQAELLRCAPHARVGVGV